MPETKKFPIMMRIMHWVSGILIIGALAIGIYMTRLPGDPYKWEMYALHKSFGVIIFALVVLRIITRLRSEVPGLPEGITQFESMLSSAVKFLMYVCMFIIPLSGYIASTSSGNGVKLFSLTMPNFFAEKNFELAKMAITLHGYAAFFLIGLICLHLTGALKHLLVDRINIYKRMI